MNRISLVILFATMLLNGVAGHQQEKVIQPKAETQLKDGGTCTPWRPQICRQSIAGSGDIRIAEGGGCVALTSTNCPLDGEQNSAVAGGRTELADGGTCIPWTPTSCPLGVGQPINLKLEFDLADGGTCIPWTPQSCPLVRGELG